MQDSRPLELASVDADKAGTFSVTVRIPVTAKVGKTSIGVQYVNPLDVLKETHRPARTAETDARATQLQEKQKQKVQHSKAFAVTPGN